MFAVKLRESPAIQFYREKPPTTFFNEVMWFHADGDELITIRAQFKNIPITEGNICRWTGEMANFIFHNLRLE